MSYQADIDQAIAEVVAAKRKYEELQKAAGDARNEANAAFKELDRAHAKVAQIIHEEIERRASLGTAEATA